MLDIISDQLASYGAPWHNKACRGEMRDYIIAIKFLLYNIAYISPNWRSLHFLLIQNIISTSYAYNYVIQCLPLIVTKSVTISGHFRV